MKNIKQKIILALFIIAMLTGCSAASAIDTQLVIQPDLSGERIMDITVNETTFSENFHGTLDDLNAIISANIPADISWKNDAPYHYVAVLGFSSPADYKQKVERILGEEHNVTITAPNSVWAKGISAEEDFSSNDLLSCVSDAMVEAGYVDSGNASYIFGDGKVTVVWQEKEYSTGSRIDVTDIEYLPLNSIDILTDVNDLNSFSGRVIFDIPMASYNAKTSQITEYLEGIVPSGASFEWSDTSTGKKMCILMDTPGDGELLTAFLQASLDSTGNLAYQEETKDSNDYFVLTENLVLKYSLESMAGSADGKVELRTFYKPGEGIQLIDDYGEFLEQGDSDDTGYEGYVLFHDEEVSNAEETVHVWKPYTIQSATVDIKDIGTKTDRLEKTTTVVFSEDPSQEDGNQILSGIKQAAGIKEDAETEAESSGDETVADETKEDVKSEKEEEPLSMEISSKEDPFSIIIKENGSRTQLQSNMTALFSNGERGVFYYIDGEETNLLKVIKKGGIGAGIDYTYFIKNCDENFHMDVILHPGFLRNYSGDSKINADGSDITIKKEGSSLVLTSTDSARLPYIGLVTKRINLIAVGLWLIMLLGFGIILFIMYRKHVFANLKMEIQQEKSGIYYCPNCGNPYHRGDTFCENCGQKL